MGAAKAALVVAALATTAHADGVEAALGACTGLSPSGEASRSHRGERFATCFDLGNRLSITAGSDGIGVALGLRHELTFEDDPDLEWKMQHALLTARHSALAYGDTATFSGTFYRGRYLRHARDGHLVIPLGGTPKKVFLPFDIGALFELGSLDWRAMQPTFAIGVVRVAPLVDFARARDYRRIFAIGPAMHWDMDVDRSFQRVSTQTVAPFTEGLANIHLESMDGLDLFDLRVEAGTAWRSDRGWHPEARAEATFERIVIAINDRPVALTAGVQYDSVRAETVARIGARFVVVDRTHPRVALHPLRPRVISPPSPPPPEPPVPEVPPATPPPPTELPSLGDQGVLGLLLGN